jgi:hypothetical protein
MPSKKRAAETVEDDVSMDEAPAAEAKSPDPENYDPASLAFEEQRIRIVRIIRLEN